MNGDGITQTYTNWSSGEPNDSGSGEDYTEISDSGATWNDIPDTFAGTAIVEWD